MKGMEKYFIKICLARGRSTCTCSCRHAHPPNTVGSCNWQALFLSFFVAFSLFELVRPACPAALPCLFGNILATVWLVEQLLGERPRLFLLHSAFGMIWMMKKGQRTRRAHLAWPQVALQVASGPAYVGKIACRLQVLATCKSGWYSTHKSRRKSADTECKLVPTWAPGCQGRSVQATGAP